MVWPASTPVPNRSNSNLKLSGMPPSPRVGIVPFTPKRLCLTLTLAWPSSPQAPSKQIFEGRNASSQSGSNRPLMSWM